jgi:hypothetical protein
MGHSFSVHKENVKMGVWSVSSINSDINPEIIMKNFIKIVLCTALLTVASLSAFATRPPEMNVQRPAYSVLPVQPASTIPETASGYWYSYQLQGLNLVLNVGNYYASGFGLSNCGKVLKATVSIPRTGPVSAWIASEGDIYNSNGTGIPYGQTFNLLTRQALAGTMSITGFNPTAHQLTVQISTPAGGPNGTYVLNRSPTLASTALIVPNCP